MRSIQVRALSAAIALTLAMITPALAQGSRDAILAAVRQWEDLYASRNPAAVAGLYSEDALLLPPNAEMVEGRAGIQAFIQETMAAGAAAVTTETVEIDSAGDLGYRVATYRVFGAGREILDRGKVVEVWKRVGGEWKLHRDIWNSNLPAAEAGGEE